MFKLEGFNNAGFAIIGKLKEYKYSELPAKGLGKSMESVGINEAVIILQSDIPDYAIWTYTEAEIERRAYELNADINLQELPPSDSSSEKRYRIWLSPKRG